MHICIFEDQGYASLLPLAHMRPVFDLRCGVLTLREKLTRLVPGARVTLVLRPSLTAVAAEEAGRGVAVNVPPASSCWLLNGRLLPDARVAAILRSKPKESRAWTRNGALALAYLTGHYADGAAGMFAAGTLGVSLLPASASEEAELDLIRYPWDLVHRSAAEIVRDFGSLTTSRARGRIGTAVHVVNRTDVRIGPGSVLKPGVVLDASGGPVLIGSNVTVMPNAVLTGPVSVGSGSVIKAGAKIYPGTSIGEHCKAGGEIEASVIHGFSNKQHDGYLGHSVLGSWVNIGADTNTSDLKNTYGTVKVPINGTLVESGEQFVGSAIGDHAKTGINVMLDTGAVLGVSANIFGAGIPPKYVPSFSWGGAAGMTGYDLEQAVATARRMMRRRGVEMTQAYETLFRSVHAATAAERAGGARRGT